MGLALVHELGGEDAAVVDVAAVLVLLLVQHAEFVAVADVEREVDVPAENLVRQRHDRLGRHAGLLAGREQRRRDPRASSDDLGLERILDVVDREAVVGTGHRQRQRVADLAIQGLQRAVDVRERDDVAGAHDIECAADFGSRAQFGQRRHVEADRAENAVERVIALHGVVDAVGIVDGAPARRVAAGADASDQRRQVD